MATKATDQPVGGTPQLPRVLLATTAMLTFISFWQAEAMGSTLAKFSVSALMFDYILTGPISGVSAGQYLAGFINEVLSYLHVHASVPTNSTAALFAALVTLYFWWQNIKGIEESSEKAVRIMEFTTVMVVLMIGWCGYTLSVRGGHLPPWPRPANLHFSK